VGSGAASRRDRFRAETRAAILDAARQIVTAKGVEDFSLREVARAVGYSPAALYEYFASKEDMLSCLYFESSGGLGQRLADIVATRPNGTPVIEDLKALGRGYRAFAIENPALYRLIFTINPLPRPPAGEPDREGPAYQALVDTVARGIEAGEFVAMSPLVVAVTCWSFVHGFVMLELNGHLTPATPPGRTLDQLPARPPADDLFEAVLHTLEAGVLRRG
jgi:AcrR family transcriptional regulator